MGIKEIVNIVINRETKPIAQEGFGIMLFVSKHKRFNDLVRYYEDMDGISADFDVGSPEYLAANAAFSAKNPPVTFGIGRCQQSQLDITVSPAGAGAVYAFTIQQPGKADLKIQYTQSGTNDIATILAGLEGVYASAFGLGQTAVVMTSSGSGNSTVLHLNATAGGALGTVFSILPAYNPSTDASLSSALTFTPVAWTADPSYAASLALIADVDSSWYGLAIDSRLQSDILGTLSGGSWSGGVAQWVEANEKLFYCADNTSDCGSGSDTTSTLVNLTAAGLVRTVFVYHESSTLNSEANLFPEVAFFATIAAMNPGSYMAAYKDLVGFAPSALSTTFSGNVRHGSSSHPKYGNTFELIAGARITREGKVVGNEYIDVIIFCDWLKARLTEAIYALIVNSPKIPFTDHGIQAIGGQIKSVFDLGVQVGGIADDTPYVINLPKSKDVPVADRSNRKLTGITTSARLAGAIQSVDPLTVTVTV